MGGGDPEDPDHGITDELLHDPAVGLDLLAGHREVVGEHLADVLGIGRLRGCREADQIAEQRRDDLAFLGEGASGIAQGGSALSAEVEPFQVLVAA